MTERIRLKKNIFTTLRIAISGGLIVFLVSFLNVGEILRITSRIWKLHPEYLIIALVMVPWLIFLEACRLQMILNIQDIHLPLARLTRYCFIGMFFNNFMPTTIGGDVAKGFYISHDSGKKVEPFVALVVVRIIGSVCLTLIALVALIIGYDILPNKTPVFMVALLVIGMGFMLVFFTRRKLASKFLIVLKPFKSKGLRQNVIAVYRLFHSYKHFPIQIGTAALITFGIEFLIISLNFMVARGLGLSAVSFKMFLLLIPMIAVATLLPSLNGLGVREGAYIYFFKNLIGTESAGALSLVMLALIIYIGLMGGIVFIASGSLTKARPQPFPEEDIPGNNN